MFAVLEHVEQPLRSFRQAGFQILAVLMADAEHDDRHLELAQHIGLGIRRQPLAQEICAGEDADVEVVVELVEPAAVLVAVVEMPERDLLGMRRDGTQSSLTDQIVTGVADVAKLLKKLVLGFGLFLPFRIGNRQAIRAIGEARVMARNARQEDSWTHA
ncbi:hypothetical protein D9M68_613340 [compost metagenome]